MELQGKERMILEIIAGVIFLALLVLGSIIVIRASNGSEIEIKDSFNTYNINVNQPLPYSYATKPYIIDRTDSGKPYIIDDDKRYLRYNSWARYEKVDGLFGNSIDKHQVYVKNQDYSGGYFKVVFHFEDYYGKDDSQSMTYYIRPREEKRFVLKDVSPSRYEYKRFWYEVKPLTRTTEKVYYDYNNQNRRYMRTYSENYMDRTYSYIN